MKGVSLKATLVVVFVSLLAITSSAYAHDTTGESTLEHTLSSGESTGSFSFLRPAQGEGWRVRADLAKPKKGRAARRRSLIYFGQLSDFQLADEESPARVDFMDGEEDSGVFPSSFRPQEALVPHQVDRSIRQLNRFYRSPVKGKSGARAKMDSAVMTGDLADNMQKNETQWVVRLLEGGQIDPSSGEKSSNLLCAPSVVVDGNNPSRYTGLQDYSDYPLDSQNHYDPAHPFGKFSDWPKYRGLMDRAQRPFKARGLRVKSYSIFGNHDGLVQGNEDANATFETVATGCVKPITAYPGFSGNLSLPNLGGLLSPTNILLGGSMLVPPDKDRQFVDKLQFKKLHDTGRQKDAHGFKFVDKAELSASNGSASYYDFAPRRGVRFVMLDSLAEGGVVGPSADGNIDSPQFEWLGRVLDKALRKDEYVIVFAHHAISSLTANIADELASPCTINNSYGHDINPGCDIDPRVSTPVRLGGEVKELLLDHKNVLALVAGHSHENQITAYGTPGSGFWEIKTPAIADWPTSHRVIDILNNHDGTLSIFTTLLDQATSVETPIKGSLKQVNNYSNKTLAAIGRTLAFNDDQVNHTQAEGERVDRNTELLIKDPLR